MKLDTLFNGTPLIPSWAAVGAIALCFSCSKVYAVPASSEVLSSQNSGVLDIKTCKRPTWPQESLDLKRSGTVTMNLLIGADGDVKQTKIIKSSGHVELDDAARVGISKCRFTPGVFEGKPVEAWLLFQYVWVPE
jgi:D-alanyl-D-alanine endopeptidase (penicillin-binding protein 7)